MRLRSRLANFFRPLIGVLERTWLTDNRIKYRDQACCNRKRESTDPRKKGHENAEQEVNPKTPQFFGIARV